MFTNHYRYLAKIRSEFDRVGAPLESDFGGQMCQPWTPGKVGTGVPTLALREGWHVPNSGPAAPNPNLARAKFRSSRPRSELGTDPHIVLLHRWEHNMWVCAKFGSGPTGPEFGTCQIRIWGGRT